MNLKPVKRLFTEDLIVNEVYVSNAHFIIRKDCIVAGPTLFHSIQTAKAWVYPARPFTRDISVEKMEAILTNVMTRDHKVFHATHWLKHPTGSRVYESEDKEIRAWFDQSYIAWLGDPILVGDGPNDPFAILDGVPVGCIMPRRDSPDLFALPPNTE